jgi:hypothetical protein
LLVFGLVFPAEVGQVRVQDQVQEQVEGVDADLGAGEGALEVEVLALRTVLGISEQVDGNSSSSRRMLTQRVFCQVHRSRSQRPEARLGPVSAYGFSFRPAYRAADQRRAPRFTRAA